MRSITLVAAGAMLIVGCKVAQPGAMPAVKTMPAAFPTTSDTSNISNISWRSYFEGEHLQSLIDSALHNNIDMAIAMQRIRMAHTELALRKAAFLPRVDAVAVAALDHYGDYTLNGVGNFDTNLSPNIKDDQRIPETITPDYFVGLRSNWEIDLWGKLKSRKKAAVAGLLATEQGRHLIVTQLVADVATRYYELVALDSELEIVNRNIALQEQAVEVVKVQKEAGKATELAVQQFTAQLMNTKTIAYRIQRLIVETENGLNLLLGRYPSPIARDTSIMQLSLPAYTNVGTPSQLLIKRPDILQAEYRMQAARADIDAARAEFLPSLNLTPYLGLNAFKSALLFNPASLAYGLATSLAAPVINQRQVKGNFELSNTRARAAVYEYQQALINGYTEVVTHLKNINNTKQMYELKQKEVSQLAGAVSTAKELYLTGYANYLEIITAQRGVLEAELQLIELKKEIFHQVIGLYRALGGGWEDL